jgi:hypothetical protein
MPNVERECVTHHYACDCREAKFKRMEAENAELRRAEGVYESLWIAAVKALRAIEWWKGNEVHYCILCCGSKEDTGHAPDCLIGLALKGSDMDTSNATSDKDGS